MSGVGAYFAGFLGLLLFVGLVLFGLSYMEDHDVSITTDGVTVNNPSATPVPSGAVEEGDDGGSESPYFWMAALIIGAAIVLFALTRLR